MTQCRAPVRDLVRAWLAMALGVVLLGWAGCAAPAPGSGDAPAGGADPAAAIDLRHEDGYITGAGGVWRLGSATVERVVVLAAGRLETRQLCNRQSGRELVPPGGAWDELAPAVLGVADDGPWALREARATRLAQGELQLVLTLARGPLIVTRTYVVHPGSSIIREWLTLRNAGDQPVPVTEPRFLVAAARLGSALGDTSFHWMTGAENRPGSWTLRTEPLSAGQPRRFDNQDAMPVPGRGLFQPGQHRLGSTTYAPWYALHDRQTQDGLVIGWDYMGHWASEFVAEADGTVRAALRVAGHRQTLAPGQTVTLPKAFVGLFRGDLDDAGNELLDWQYRYLWDYTRAGWSPAVPMLGWWQRGTNWDQPGGGGTGRCPDLPSQFTKIFATADLMRTVGADAYQRDWGWWDRAGDWNGPDFGASRQYLAKYGMRQIIYAFLYTVDPESKVAQEHPDWLVGDTLDMSRPEVVAFMRRQLDDFHQRWGAFAWRNDSRPTAPRPGPGGDTVLLGQDQGLRTVIQGFLDQHPDCAFNAVNNGGDEGGYDYVRLAMVYQYTDGGQMGHLGNYYTTLLFPPDKCADNGDSWLPEQYQPATWRGLLTGVPVVTGTTRNRDKLEGLRELLDLYHYLVAQGVAGRWVKVYRPRVEGDEPTLYLQRLSRDRQRGVLVPKRPAPGRVTLWPKGLVPEAEYLVSFQEAPQEGTRTGADLMARGVTLERMPPGELIYLNLPYHPGNRRDRQPPTPPGAVTKQRGDNMGFPGVELSWQPARDDQWVSYYEVLRDGQALDKVAKGTFYFDHSAGADPAARYEVRAVDGAGNASARATATGPAGAPSQVFDDTDPALRFSGAWQRERDVLPAHGRTITCTKEPGAAVELAFTGRRVLWFGKLNANCGQARVRLDDGPAEVVDTYCADEVWSVCVYQKELPVAGRHVLRIEAIGQKHPRASDTWVHVDGLRVEP